MDDFADDRQTFAVILAPPGSERVAVRALSGERAWRVQAFCDPLCAFAELALSEQARQTHAAWEDREFSENEADAINDGEQRTAFVLAHPPHWAVRHELLDAIRRYLPHVQLFAFDERGLHEASASRKAKCKSRAVDRGGRGERGEDAETQLNGVRSEEAAQTTERLPKPAAAESAISREEIDMLLGGGSR